MNNPDSDRLKVHVAPAGLVQSAENRTGTRNGVGDCKRLCRAQNRDHLIEDRELAIVRFRSVRSL